MGPRFPARCRKTEEARCDYGDKPFFAHPPAPLTAADIIRRRRSATAFDPDSSIDQECFFALLDKTLPRNHCAPFDVELGATAVHLLLFVHNVPPLARGLYFFCRTPEDLQALRKAFRPDFLWEPVTDDLPLPDMGSLANALGIAGEVEIGGGDPAVVADLDHPAAAAGKPCSRHRTGTATCSGKPEWSVRCSTSRPRRTALAGPVSVVFSMTRSTTWPVSPTAPGRASTTLRSVDRSRTPG